MLEQREVTWSGSRLGRGIPKADAWVVSWAVCGVEVCHGKLLPFLDTLEHTLSCARGSASLLRSARGRWFLPPCLGFLPKWARSIPQLLQAGVAAGMLHSGGTRIPFLWVVPTSLWGAQSVFETWGSRCEEEEEEGSSSPNPATPKASGDAGCWRHRSSFSWIPCHGLVYFGARAPMGSPPIHPIRILQMLPLMPHNGICWGADAW